MADVVLECRGLVKRFGPRTAVDGVGFVVARGETYGLLGPNGAGKTTTISMLCGLLRPDEGSVQVGGHPLEAEPLAAKAAIGLVPQDIALYEELSARENLRFFGRLQGMAKAELAERVDEVLELVGLADRATDVVGTYSGGMKRRANIAVGLLHRPQLLVLDEPTVGVDPQSRNAILERVEALADGGLSVLYTTHYMEEAERLCDRIGIIDEGQLVAEGTRDELVGQARREDEAAGRFGTTPDLEAVFLRRTGKALRD
jgi:ABC-2 type transport system ATP-binding protein